MKIRETIYRCVADAMSSLGFGGSGVPVILERPKDSAHGDMSTPVAMMLAKSLRKNPNKIAEEIAGKLSFPDNTVSSVDVMKPGFVNFRFHDAVLKQNLLDVLSAGDAYGSSSIGSGASCQVEYVSANPTGPLVVVSARAAAIGSVIVNLLRFSGFEVASEYYLNDYGGQVRALGDSLKYRIRERFGMLDPGEEIGVYPGEYLKTIAESLPDEQAQGLAADTGAAAERYAIDAMLSSIRSDLDAFGVTFDNFFAESTLHPAAVESALEFVQKEGYTYEKDGATYFRSTDLGDDKDRVLRKSGGDPTYFLSDIAYHRDKIRRGFKKAIDLLGPDHHGHVPRMKAAMSVLGAGADWLEVILVGWVRLMEEGQPVSMSKRAGEFITMRELIDDVGSDVAKYFFLMRRSNSPLDFDLTLARKQSDENPVYYVQYAHARISSVTRFAREKGCTFDTGEVNLGLLRTEEERALMLRILYFPYVVEGGASSREPHRLTAYAQELATAFHQFYHECRIVSDDGPLSSARLLLAEATMQVLRNSLHLLGVGAPSSM